MSTLTRTGGILAWRWSVSRGGKQEFGFGIILSFPVLY